MIRSQASPRFVSKVLTYCAPMPNRNTEPITVESCVLQAKEEHNRLALQKLCLNHPPEKKCKKAEWLWGGLANSWEKKRIKRQRRKGKIYPTECRVQRIARRDKKGFVSEQCKEIEESNTMGKTRNLSKKIGDIKGTFHARMGTIKTETIRI